MLFGWLAEHRRHKIIDAPFPPEWEQILEEELAFFAWLNEEERSRLRDDVRIFAAEKNWEGCGGQEMTDEIKVCVSAQASLLTLCREHDYYANVESILVYPTAYRSRATRRDESGAVQEGMEARLGEAWRDGPIVISWFDVKLGASNPDDGHNVVFHEFAHKLDMNDREANGVPLLDDDAQVQEWDEVMNREFSELVRQSEHGHASLLDSYGATNPAEFFAVATECFFEKPVQMREKHAPLYHLLSSYFHQDPATRIAEMQSTAAAVEDISPDSAK